MTQQGNASNNQDDDQENRRDGQEPGVVPPDYASAEQKARERGKWVMEAILKGAVSGGVRAALREGLDHLGL